MANATLRNVASMDSEVFEHVGLVISDLLETSLRGYEGLPKLKLLIHDGVHEGLSDVKGASKWTPSQW